MHLGHAACGPGVREQPPAFAQGGSNTTTLSGVVVDPSGGVLPGVTVEAKENATGVTYTAVSDDQGRFAISNIMPGTYTVKVSLLGFKTFVAPDIRFSPRRRRR